MKLLKFVCPNNEKLLQSLRGCTLAVRVQNPSQAGDAAAAVRSSGNDLFCVIIESAMPLGQVELSHDLKGIPLALIAPSLGRFRDLVKHLRTWRELNLRVYLPCDNTKNFVGLQMLSSVGIESGALIGNGKVDWESMSELMTYAVLSRVPHAAIEPFAYIACHYDSSSYLKWGSLFFDDPAHFLHLDKEGHVAISAADLVNQQFIADSVGALGEPAECAALKQHAQAWKGYFLENHPCVYCAAWKICLGNFASLPPGNGCSEFFTEMIDVARQQKAETIAAREGSIWQP